MLKKVSFWDNTLRKKFLEQITILSTILSLILIFFDIPINIKLIGGVIFFLFLSLYYIWLWWEANNLNSVVININKSTIKIKIGDIFEELKEDEIKVIAFNEYFDTIVDDKIISKNSLNGIFINKITSGVSKEISLAEFDELIRTDDYLNDECLLNWINDRKSGKKQKYKLGSIFEYKDYFLTAMTKFDDNNRAFLDQKEFIEFLLQFWDNIDKKYNGRTIIIPVLGTGITRFKDKIDIEEQELLNIIIWSFKLSRIKFTYPSEIKIIIYKDKKDKINLYEIKKLENL